MNLTSRQRIFFRFLPLVVLLLAPSAFPQSAGTSVELYTLFIGRGYKTDYQGLSPSQSEIFPRNILISIPAAGQAAATDMADSLPAGKDGGLQVSPKEKRLENVTLIFQQRDVAESKERFLGFAEELAGAALPFRVTLLLAANGS